MQHLRMISRTPAKAQSGLCTDISSATQAKLCFTVEVLTGFILPMQQLKDPSLDDDGNGGNGETNGEA